MLFCRDFYMFKGDKFIFSWLRQEIFSTTSLAVSVIGVPWWLFDESQIRKGDGCSATCSGLHKKYLSLFLASVPCPTLTLSMSIFWSVWIKESTPFQLCLEFCHRFQNPHRLIVLDQMPGIFKMGDGSLWESTGQIGVPIDGLIL